MRSSNQKEARARIVFYTDGSCAPTNPGPGGWAYLPVVDGVPSEVVNGSEPRSTNNRMELTAAIEALKTCPDGESVDLFTDSEYVRLGITQWMDAWIRNGWTRRKRGPVLNKDLWVELHEQNSRLRVDWHWVKAHAGDSFNEVVDQAARNAAMSAGSRDGGSTLSFGNLESVAEETSPNVDYFITAATSGENRGAWAFVRVVDDDEDTSYDVLDRSSANRSLLIGAIELMRSLTVGESVRVATDSEYLYKGVTQWIEAWRQRGWRKSDDKPVANKDLWIEIHALLDDVTIDWRLERRADTRSSVSLIDIAARAARDALEMSKP